MKLKIGFFTILLALTLILNPSPFTPAAFLAALFHELGHILMAKLCHIRLRECSIGLFGAGLAPDYGTYSYRQEILLCLAGPLTNLVLGTLALLLPASDLILAFILSSFFLGLLNLLPIQTFDGGRILSHFLSLKLSPSLSHRLLRVLSFLCVFLMWCFSVYLLLRAAASLSLFVFSLSLFVKLFIEDGEA
ncbi:MAG: M50 family metallopeptidase [Clostridia bacterium]|nr:M50 family metallopeptidase [Clostridia bacterium]